MSESISEQLSSKKPAVSISSDQVDLSLAYNHMFSPAAKRGLARKVTILAPAGEKFAYFAVLALGEEKIVKAAREIANAINSLAGKGCVTGCLSNLFVMPIANKPHELEKFVVCCFPVLTEEGYSEIQGEQYNAPLFGLAGSEQAQPENTAQQD